MKLHWYRGIWLCLIAITMCAPSLLAQKTEIHLYGGQNWGGSSSVGDLKTNGLFGAKFGYYFDPNIQIEENIGYISHFEPTSIDPKARGFLWETALNLNFSSKEFPFKRQFTPFISGGLGGITTKLVQDVSFQKNQLFQFTDGSTLTAVNNYTISGGDTFFTFSYGGGIKSVKLAGPFGLRLDARGRTIPNYYGGSSPTWFELTGGINFMFGEK